MTAPTRQPVTFVPHGGGPWPFVDVPIGDPAQNARLAEHLVQLSTLSPTRPGAILVISAHWEEPAVTVQTGAHPELLFDYYGFPEEAYRLRWPAPGAPEVAERAVALLDEAGLAPATDPERGFDHGTFVPLKLAFPDADVPTFQVSLVAGLDPAVHLALGRALAPLRDEGVLVVGSGMSFHNMRAFGTAGGVAAAQDFDRWLAGVAPLPAEERDAELLRWAEAPSARAAHPREEHLLPLLVCAGAAGGDQGRVDFSGRVLDVAVSGVRFG